MSKSENPWAASVKPRQENPENFLLTYEEAARLLRVSKRTVERMVANGEIPVVRVGRAPRIRRATLMEWIENGGNAVVEEKEADHGKFGF